MDSLKVGVDLDGCLYDFVAGLRSWIVQSTGRCPTTLPDADRWEFYSHQWGLTLEEFLTHYHAGVNAGVVFSEGAPYPGSSEALVRLREQGHTLHVVTDRGGIGSPGVSERLTAQWLQQHSLPHDSLLLASDKTCIAADVFLEDRLVNAEALSAAGTHVLLIDRPWNQSVLPQGVTRVRSWSDVPSLVASLTV